MDWLGSFLANAQKDIVEGVQLPWSAGIEGVRFPRELPRRLWIYWAQGWDEAPPQSKLCLESWLKHNSDWDIAVLDDRSLPDHIDIGATLDGKTITLTGRSNLIRLRLLARYGGVWADASTFCSRPLSHWLPQLMQSGFFAFARPGPDRALSTWFLAAEADNYLIRRWIELMEKYWSQIETNHFYFWTHYLFAEGCRTDEAMNAIWHSTPWISADGPHAVQHASDVGSHGLRLSLGERRVPLHKLERRRPGLPGATDQTPLAWLLHEAY